MLVLDSPMSLMILRDKASFYYVEQQLLAEEQHCFIIITAVDSGILMCSVLVVRASSYLKIFVVFQHCH